MKKVKNLTFYCRINTYTTRPTRYKAAAKSIYSAFYCVRTQPIQATGLQPFPPNIPQHYATELKTELSVAVPRLQEAVPGIKIE